MKKILVAIATISGMSLLALPMQAAAHDGYHAMEPWVAWDTSGESFEQIPAEHTTIVDSHTVDLSVQDPAEDSKGTSLETPNLGLEVGDGTMLAFHHETLDGAGCGDNDLRAFVVIDGVQTNTWDGTKCGEDGMSSVLIENGGTIEFAGLVLDNAPPEEGTVRVSDLTIDDRLISFNPPPAATPLKPTLTQPTCETPEPELTIPEVEGVTYAVDGSVTPGHTVTVTATADEGYVLTEGEWTWDFSITAIPGCDGKDGEDGRDGEDGKDGEDAPTPTPDPSPTPSPDPDPSPSPTPGDTLPDTGAPVLPMTLAGVGLAGAGALLRKVFG